MIGGCARKKSAGQALALAPSSVLNLQYTNVECVSGTARGLLFLAEEANGNVRRISAKEGFVNEGIICVSQSAPSSSATDPVKLELVGGFVVNSNQISVGSLSVEAGGDDGVSFKNEAGGRVTMSEKLQITAPELENGGHLSSDVDSTFSLDFLRNFAEERIEAASLAYRSKEVKNHGRLMGKKELALSGDVFTNAGSGRAVTRGGARVEFNVVENDGKILAGDRLDLNLGDKMENRDGALVLAREINLPQRPSTDGAHVENCGYIYASGQMDAKLKSLDTKIVNKPKKN